MKLILFVYTIQIMWDLLFRFIDGEPVITKIENEKDISSKKYIMMKRKEDYNKLKKQATDLISKIERLQQFLEKFNNKI